MGTARDATNRVKVNICRILSIKVSCNIELNLVCGFSACRCRVSKPRSLYRMAITPKIKENRNGNLHPANLHLSII